MQSDRPPKASRPTSGKLHQQLHKSTSVQTVLETRLNDRDFTVYGEGVGRHVIDTSKLNHLVRGSMSVARRVELYRPKLALNALNRVLCSSAGLRLSHRRILKNYLARSDICYVLYVIDISISASTTHASYLT